MSVAGVLPGPQCWISREAGEFESGDQQASFSKTSWSVSCSVCSCACMSFSRLMTLVTGYSFSALLSRVAPATAIRRAKHRIVRIALTLHSSAS